MINDRPASQEAVQGRRALNATRALEAGGFTWLSGFRLEPGSLSFVGGFVSRGCHWPEAVKFRLDSMHRILILTVGDLKFPDVQDMFRGRLWLARMFWRRPYWVRTRSVQTPWSSRSMATRRRWKSSRILTRWYTQPGFGWTCSVIRSVELLRRKAAKATRRREHRQSDNGGQLMG